ncbi:hypothetical protein ACWDXV_23350 [Nocardia nova]|uniref:hypothetical protein n=1 Tax=Nocardia nova TaxID=37330 RepID=UPI000CEA0F16|nr:hypothetical protein [Nocardia nova]PPJ01068.1 hypothetical protein C5E51_34820 [Nocardia nova]PPJ21300.1 hypothetical protein C5E44_06995 [Nocardia nova]
MTPLRRRTGHHSSSPARSFRGHKLLIFVVGLLIGLALSGHPLMTVPGTRTPGDDKRPPD